MSTRKIIDAKQNGEKVWLKGHAQAIYMSDGNTVEDVINDIKVNGSGNTDLSDYETKVESQNKLQEAKDYTDTAIANLVDSKQDTIIDLDTIRQGAAKGATALQSYTEQYKGTVQAVETSETIDDVETNAYVKYVVLTLTDTLKLQVRENIGAASFDDIPEFRKDGDGTQFLSNNGTYKTLYTTTEIDSKLGDINTILESIING